MLMKCDRSVSFGMLDSDVDCEIVSIQQILWVIHSSYKSSVLQSDLVRFSDLTHNLNTEAEPDVSLESEVKQTEELNMSI